MAGVRKNKLPSGKYRGWYMANGKQRFFTGTKSKTTTKKMADTLEDQHRLAALGIDSLVLQAERRRNTSFADTKDEYLAWGQTQGGRNNGPWGATHARNRRSHLDWWQGILKLDTLADLEGSLSAVEGTLRALKKEGLSNKTLNNYAEALRAFCTWCLKRDLFDKDPLRHLQRLDESIGSLRRALQVEEINRLRAHAPYYRWIVYWTALETGLRANELRSLTVGDLDTKDCFLRLHKAWTKNRRDGFQPISSELAQQLLAWADSGEARALYLKHFSRKQTKTAIPSNRLLYVPTHTARSLDLDLAAAGIPKKTDEGKLDFHALRTAFITLAIEDKEANIKEVQTLARHSTPQITLNHYARVRPDHLTAVVGSIGARIRGQADDEQAE